MYYTFLSLLFEALHLKLLPKPCQWCYPVMAFQYMHLLEYEKQFYKTKQCKILNINLFDRPLDDKITELFPQSISTTYFTPISPTTTKHHYHAILLVLISDYADFIEQTCTLI